jgi:rhodanese-related sulfurtransferase
MKWITLSLWLGCLMLTPALLRADEKPADKSKVQKIDVEQFDQKRKEKDAVVLDVRTPQEYREGHVPGAVNLDIHDPKFADKVGQLDKSKTYLVHCAKGYRSAQATAKMSNMGFDNLFDFHGGFTAWENDHKPIEKGEPETPSKSK